MLRVLFSSSLKTPLKGDLTNLRWTSSGVLEVLSLQETHLGCISLISGSLMCSTRWSQKRLWSCQEYVCNTKPVWLCVLQQSILISWPQASLSPSAWQEIPFACGFSIGSARSSTRDWIGWRTTYGLKLARVFQVNCVVQNYKITGTWHY